MSLVDLIQDLVDNPQRLSEYKQDPAGYLERAGIQPAKRAFGLPGQIHTVMSLVIPVGGDTVRAVGEQAESASGAAQESSISLDGTPIEITTLQPTFLAEGQVDQPYLLLPHSYVSITEDQKYFDLHLLYLRAGDPTDSPQVLYIKTQAQPKTIPSPVLPIRTLSLTVSDYLLVSNAPPVVTQLVDPSTYNNGVLTLSIDYSDSD